ncbi:hypothetical protein L3Q82_000198 [Scortum barcoo]|uniref:Uncharacterized protein n=1 Tax=Scortum barcoo TaxID=214431 RepID=A0ACB8X9G5_9TELE|nr:hypothetical protein L3Q82_000198 [Scortum barcoo]
MAALSAARLRTAQPPGTTLTICIMMLADKWPYRQGKRPFNSAHLVWLGSSGLTAPARQSSLMTLAVVGLITDGYRVGREYRGLIQNFVDWCLRNNLQINTGKTKELVVDFRRRSHSPLPAPVNILGMDIDVVKSYEVPGCSPK